MFYTHFEFRIKIILFDRERRQGRVRGSTEGAGGEQRGALGKQARAVLGRSNGVVARLLSFLEII